MDNRAVALCAAVCVQATVVSAQVRPMTLADVLARARERAPQIVSARLALEETRGRLAGASIRLPSNPEIDTAVGNRQASGNRFTDVEVGVSQMFEPGARRSARVAGVDAAIAQGTADVEETTRIVLRTAAAAYYRAVHARERLRLLTASRDLAANVHRVADRRFKAGDIAVLDVNIARAVLARANADLEAAEAARTQAIGELQQLLAIDDTLSIEGALTRGAEPDLAALLQASSQRPELRALEAAVQEAEADVRLGHAFSKPDYGLGVKYSREAGDDVVLGGLRLTWPIFSKGQELRAVGSARAARLRAELDAARARVRIEVRTSFDVYARRVAALRVLETDAIPGLDENDALATRSFDVGQLGLPELLLMRREILDTRSHHLDALLEAALARIDLDASAAILR